MKIVFPSSLAILGTRPFVREFFRKFPQHQQFKTKFPKDFTRIIEEFHLDFIQAVVDNRSGADLPLKCGNLKIIAFKKTRDYPNFSFYRKEGITTGFTNNHTGGLSCKIVFSNKSNRYKIKDKIMWSFQAEVPFKKRVSEAFKANYQKYMFSANIFQIKKKNNFYKWKDLTDEHIEKYLIDYNEFEIN